MEPKTVRRAAFGQKSTQSAHEACHGFPVGTQILTPSGHRPVESLNSGDFVITRNGGAQPLVDIQKVTRTARAIRFTAECFGKSGPEQDILLPEAQPVLIRDWRARALFGQSQAMIRAGQLVDDAFIHDAGTRQMVLFRLTFDRARLVHGLGLELGTGAEALTPWRAVA